MEIIHNIKYFLETGKLGEKGIASNYRSFLSEFKSDNWHDHHNDNISYASLPPYLITALENKIIGIELLLKQYSMKIGDSRYNLKSGSSLETVCRILSENNITWIFDKDFTFTDQLCITTCGNVNLLFSKEDKGKIVLRKAAITGLR